MHACDSEGTPGRREASPPNPASVPFITIIAVISNRPHEFQLRYLAVPARGNNRGRVYCVALRKGQVRVSRLCPE
jgi:hypothetical protein